jgi:WD40 repeat protein
VISLGEVCRHEHLWVFCQIDDHRFAFGGLNGKVWLWDMRSKEEVLLGSVGFKTAGLGIGPGGHLLACFDDGTLMIWNVDANGDPVSILLDGRPVALSCAPTSSYVSVGLADGEILAFKLCGAS